ncbi:hypothetical protein KF7HA_00342 [Lactococcus lactis]|nr:hypothetical protein [Lactococcus lactis]
MDKDGNYSIKLPTGVKPGTQLSATATDAAGNVSDSTDFIIPALTSGMAIGNSGIIWVVSISQVVNYQQQMVQTLAGLV